MHGNILHAPVKDPKRIVDIGCGPGATTLDLATKFPNAQVYGVDLLAIPEEHASPLPNVDYIQGDVMKLRAPSGDACLAPGSLDYVFQRLLVCGMTEWPHCVKTIVGSVKSGGCVEIHEMDFISGRTG
jgi:trans-aconitate methyltransferase